MKVLTGLSAFLHWLEELITMASGPLLTAGLAIALVDLLTDGRLLASAPALLFGWAISQALGVDGQLVGASVKCGRAMRAHHVWIALAYLPLIAMLAIVAYLASNVFATQEAFGLSTRTALAQLGMSPTLWIVARSGLAVFLVILSGLLRYETARVERVESDEERAQKRRRQMEDAQHKAQLRAAQAAGWVGMGKAALATAKGTTPDVMMPPEEDAGEPGDLSPDAPEESPAFDPDPTPFSLLKGRTRRRRLPTAQTPLQGRVTADDLTAWVHAHLGVTISRQDALAFVKSMPGSGRARGVPGAPISAPKPITYARAKVRWAAAGQEAEDQAG